MSHVTDQNHRWWALAAVGSGVFMATVDGSIVNIALKTLQDHFGAGLHEVEWVVLAYLLAITCLLPSMGRLGDMVGKRRVYLAGFVVFTVGSALCGLAWSVEALVAFRVLQAVGAAMLQALGPALLVTAFPPQQRGQALGYIGTVVAAGILTGPVLGGLLLRSVGWPSIFYVNIPLGALAILISLRALPDDRQRSEQRFDLAGAGLLAGGLLLALLALTEGQVWGFSDWRTLAALAAGLLGLAGFVLWERRAPAPMISLGLFANPTFSLSLLAAFTSFLAAAFNFLLLPFYLQNVLGFDPQRTGLTLIATPAALSLISPLSGRLSDRFGARWLGVIGLALTALALASFATLTTASTQLDVVLRLLLMGAGFGLFQSPNNSTIMGSAPRSALGVAGSLLAVMRTLGQTAGVALAGAVWAAQVTAAAGRAYEPVTSAPPQALVAGLHSAMLVAAALAALGIVPAAMRSRPAPSEQPARRPAT
ncbi:MAG TPA: MFS transporter [Roseiflexaceae bacterium]|nr:MFS transporter [Roseiflexaceae bacterium]